MIKLLVFAAAAGAVPAAGRSAPPAAAAIAPAAEPARLAAAHALLDEMMPPAQREQMMIATIKPALANMRATIAGDPQFQKMIGTDPQARAVFDRFVRRMLDESLASTRKNLPQLFDAMAIAYARNFSVAELGYVRGFYANPIGRNFMAKMPQIMADPTVQASQREMIKDSMSRMPVILEEMKAEMVASSGTKK